MKTIVEINNNNYGSTGSIAINIANEAEKNDFEVYLAIRKSRANLKNKNSKQIYIGIWLDRIISERLAYITGLNGYFNVINTRLFIKKLNKLKPDLLHIHSLCDNYINIKMLFTYIKKNDIPVVWTLHDNWPFTGRCAQIRCEKWTTGCGDCPHLDYFPRSLFLDNTKHVLEQRQKIYNDVQKLTLVTPSKWMAELAKKSIFKNNHPIEVINNGIDLNVFKPTESDFRKKHNIEDKFIILGVASYWDGGIGKGLHDFIELSKRLSSDYQIVMVGTNDSVDKKLPDNIISVQKTRNREELVKIYSAANLFVNPTKDDNFPTVNLEALACGLPVLTYNTGGSAECIDSLSGNYVDKGDIDSLEKEIIRIHDTHPFTKQNCLNRSKRYDMKLKFKGYIDLYNKILNY